MWILLVLCESSLSQTDFSADPLKRKCRYVDDIFPMGYTECQTEIPGGRYLPLFSHFLHGKFLVQAVTKIRSTWRYFHFYANNLDRIKPPFFSMEFEDFCARSKHLRQWWIIASHRILWDAITYPCLRYLFLVPKSTVHLRLFEPVPILHAIP